MNITIINGTNRANNKTLNVTNAVAEIASSKNTITNIITLENFTELFRGDYITLENATTEQKTDLENIMNANIVIFTVPVYHHSIPSPLKNFFDIVSIKGLYSNSTIGMISSNSGGSTDGVRQAKEVLNGIIAYNKDEKAFIIPDVPVINYATPDTERIETFIDRLLEFAQNDTLK